MKSTIEIAEGIVAVLTDEQVRVYARVRPSFMSTRDYTRRTQIEDYVQAICRDRVGRSVAP